MRYLTALSCSLRALLLCGLLPSIGLACSGGLHIELEQSGVYALDYASIKAVQPNLSDCASTDLVLQNAGAEVPLQVVDGGDGRFDASDRIEWVGEQLHGPASWFDRYATANVYLLTANPGPHARMQEQRSSNHNNLSGLTRSLHLEQENLMIRLNQQQVKSGEEPDIWFWAKLTHVDPQPFALNFDLPDLAPRGKTISAILDFRGLSDVLQRSNFDKPSDHIVTLNLNGTILSSVAWDGRDEVKKTIELPVKALKSRGNTLSLSVPKRNTPWDTTNPLVDVAMFNFIEINYPINGNLSESAAPFTLDKATGDASFELSYSGTETPVVYSDSGHYLTAQPISKSHWRLGPVAHDVTVYASVASHYLAPTLMRATATYDWRSSKPGYDYLVITHPRLMAAIQPLAEWHRNRGLQVAVIDVNEVYDQFNNGIVHPQALRNLIDYGYRNWPRKPRYVLLVGDASFDIRHTQRNEMNYSKWVNEQALFVPGQFGSIPSTPYSHPLQDLPNRNLIPTWQYASPEGQSASDNWFVALNENDFHPVLGIGRFPVVEPEEVSAIVKKTIDYLSKPQLGAWRRDVMFITDESDYFKNTSDEIATQLDVEGFAAHKIYASAEEKDNIAHQSDIKDGLNQGQLLVHFIGHGGRFIWRTGPPDLRKNHDLFTLDDVSNLANGGRLPMVLSMTCYSAPFDNPTEDSIGERFLREPDKGAVAVFAASWRNGPQPAYSKNLIAELLKPGMPIGDAIVTAKRTMQDRTLVEMYNLLGDPALVLERPQKALKLARESNRWQLSVAVQLPKTDFQGQLTADWVDAQGRVLETHKYQINQAQFLLPPPSAAIVHQAIELRTYAVDSSNGIDAVGALRLVTQSQSDALKPTLQPTHKTLKLAREPNRWQLNVAVQLPETEFHGEVIADWLDAQGQLLETRKYQVSQTQFLLPPPPTAITNQAMELRVRAIDSARNTNATGVLRLTTATTPAVIPAKAASLSPIRAANISHYTQDTITRFNFEATTPPTPQLAKLN